MMLTKPKPLIDWSRTLENPSQYTPDQLVRLNSRINQWEALCELCADGKPLNGFDKHLTRQVRDFLQLVKSGEWPKARDKYQRIQNIRKTLGLPTQ